MEPQSLESQKYRLFKADYNMLLCLLGGGISCRAPRPGRHPSELCVMTQGRRDCESCVPAVLYLADRKSVV